MKSVGLRCGRDETVVSDTPSGASAPAPQMWPAVQVTVDVDRLWRENVHAPSARKGAQAFGLNP
jgi:hypothetical protein